MATLISMIISLDKVLKEMETTGQKGPVPFSITFVTCDLERDKGGKRITFKRAFLCKPGKGNAKHYSFRNNVRSIKEDGAPTPTAIHPILITHFNGSEVSQ